MAAGSAARGAGQRGTNRRVLTETLRMARTVAGGVVVAAAAGVVVFPHLSRLPLRLLRRIPPYPHLHSCPERQRFAAQGVPLAIDSHYRRRRHHRRQYPYGAYDLAGAPSVLRPRLLPRLHRPRLLRLCSSSGLPSRRPTAVCGGAAGPAFGGTMHDKTSCLAVSTTNGRCRSQPLWLRPSLPWLPSLPLLPSLPSLPPPVVRLYPLPSSDPESPLLSSFVFFFSLSRSSPWPQHPRPPPRPPALPCRRLRTPRCAQPGCRRGAGGAEVRRAACSTGSGAS